MTRPAVRESAVAWDLRGALAGGWEVVLALPRRRRVRGYVTHVAPTDAFALVWDGAGELHVPLGLVRSVRRPHFHEDAGAPVARPDAPELPAAMAGQVGFLVEDRPAGWTDPREARAAAAAEVARRRAEGKRRAVAREKSSQGPCASG